MNKLTTGGRSPRQTAQTLLGSQLSVSVAALAILAGSSLALAQNDPVRDAPKVTTSGVPTTAGSAVVPEFEARWYPVSKFELAYSGNANGLPAPAELLSSITVELGRNESGFVSTSRGGTKTTINPGSMSGEVVNFDRTAIADVTRGIAQELRRRGVLAVLVGPTVEEVDETGTDLRQGRTTFKLEIVVGRVGEVRTLANGERFDDVRINNPAHDTIRENSPVNKGEFLRRDALDDYAYRLNRHPGRRVDVAVAPGSEQTGDITLDYLVNENRPWYILAQLSNTGTENTSKWRERFAFVNNQLTNRDDSLRLDYVTAGFAQAHSFIGSYEFPLIIPELRLNIYGAVNKFTASDVGIVGATFRGNSWRAGAELAYNVVQVQQTFIDLLGGMRWDHIETRNATANISGGTNYFIPYAGARITRNTDISQLEARGLVEWTQNDIAGTKQTEVANLGRLNPDFSYTLLKWDANFSVYLEPLLFPGLYSGQVRPMDEDGKPATWQPGMTLASELAFSVRGQHAFDRRLISNVEEVAGGFFSVRGYPESAVAGDNVMIASAEYRMHIPRMFGITSEPGKGIFGESFRWKPQEPYGLADWDLIFRAFIDAGRVVQNNKQAFETNATLIGAGAGLELQIRRNVYIRGDWGVALRALPTQNVKTGDSRLHFMLTLLF